MTWQELERHIEDILRGAGFDLDRRSDTGDLFAFAMGVDGQNVTEFAQELHKRINAKVVKVRT